MSETILILLDVTVSLALTAVTCDLDSKKCPLKGLKTLIFGSMSLIGFNIQHSL